MIPLKRILLAAAAALLSLPLAAQVPFPGSYSENFDSMGTAGTTKPAGWTVWNGPGTSNTLWTNATGIIGGLATNTSSIGAMTINNSALTASNTPTANAIQGYNAGAPGDSANRLLGTAPTSIGGAALQLVLTNNTGSNVNGLRVSYDIRRFTTPAANQLPGYWLFYSIDSGVSWTNVSALNPTIGGPGGVVVPNSVGVTSVPQTTIIFPTSVANGSEISLRWVDDNAQESSPDQIIGLDNVSITLPVVNNAPTVVLTAPTAGANYDAPASITLSADAADSDGTIGKVEFFNGATKLGEAVTTPYQFVWNNAISGSYALTAVATDNLLGTATSAAVNITVTNTDNVAPTVTLTAPSNGATILTSSLALTADAADSDGAVSKVEFFNGATKLGEDTTSPYTYNWTGVATGTYTLTAVATDNDGATTTSAAANISVAVPITTTHIAKGSSWKFLDNGTDQGTAWKETGFDDSAWVSGPAVLGGGDTHIVTNVNLGPSGARYLTTYFRRTFNVTGAAAVQILNLNILRDDGVVVYINGTEVARQNMPAGSITYLTDTPDIVSGSDETTYFPATASPFPVLSEGPNTIAVEVHQRDGASSDLGFDLEMISLALPGASPTVSLTAPANNATFEAPATISIAADAADEDGTIAKVEFFEGANKIGEDTEAPFALEWTGIAQGGYTLTARATDNRGLTTTSTAVGITVTSPNTQPPVVALTSPADGSSFIEPATITLTATASDPDGTITKVEFFNGATKLGEDLSEPYSFEWTGVPIGDYTLTARATDNMTATGVSAAAVIHVTEDPRPRVTIAATDSKAGEYGSDRALEFTVSRTGLTTGALVVPLVAGGTATAGADYSGFSTSVTIPAGSATLPLPLTILSDDLVEGLETVTISLGGSPDFVAGSPASANAMITDRLAPTAAWRFGVIGDTQQTQNVDSTNNSCAINIISAVNQQFVARNVDLVLAVGDLGDNGSVASLQTRLAANAGTLSGITGLGAIPFYAVRGNHEDNSTAQTYFQGNFIPASGSGVTVSLAPDNTSYAVNYQGATFVLLDILATKGTTSLMDQQTTWMNSVLGSDGHEHAFVVQHKNLLGQNHKDNAFGSSNDANPTQQNNFFKVLSDNGVRYNISGHDHMNHRAIVTSPDGSSKVRQLISQSASTKFYSGTTPWSSREQCVSDEQSKIGFYIFTVEGPRITGEYWATTPVGSDIPANPVWTLRDTFGYSINGTQTTVARDGSYAGITDSTAKAISNGETGYLGTTMSILAGTNTTTGTAGGSRPEVDDLNTGWTPKPATLASDALTLWGMNNGLGSAQTDTFTLSLSYDPATSSPVLVTRVGGAWVNAVTGNTGGTNNFAGDRPFNAATDTLGSYGYDSGTHTAWAVINHNSDFAVASAIAPTVAISTPLDGASFIVAETITLTATAADTDGTVSKVEFFDGANKLGEDTAAPYSFDWTSAPVGDHSLTAKVTDNLGITAVSSAVVIHVVANQPPTVAITSPADGASSIAPATFTLTATATDADGSVSKVEFFAGSNKLGEATGAPYAYDWSNIPVGSHVLTAVATDNLGVTAISAAITITVNLPTVTIAATHASAGESGADRTLEFTITRSGPTTNSLTVPLVAGGSATEGTDYSGFVSSVTIPAGSAAVAQTLTVLPDSAVEGTETVTIALGTSADFTAGTPASADAAIADGPAQPRYVAGDWHQHTTYTDGSYSIGYQMARNNQFGLDWWANSEHGGAFNRCGRLSGTGADPLNATVTWASMGITGLGNNLAAGNMWRWQSIRDYSFADVLTARTDYPSKVIIQGYEWNVPGLKPTGAGGNGHEHCSMGSIAGEFDASPNANVVAQFEYQFDMSDGDTSSDNGMGWIKSGNPNTTDAKMVEAAAWLQANHPTTSWLTPAHPERKKNWTGATFRKLNDAAPSVAFGFESMPGHQRSVNRGEYGNGQNGSNNSNGGGTYGGGGYFSAKLGGLWDSLLGEGRHFWLFTSSDSHEVAANDFYPGEYQKTYSYASDPSSPQAIVDGLRSGNSFVVQGDLIDSLDFKVDGAVMGSTLLASSHIVTVTITVHDPEGANNGPAGFNTPTLDHMDLIAGEFGGLIPASDPAYSSESNPSTAVIARFDATGGVTDANGITSIAWNDLGGGTKQMSIPVNTLGKKLYFRLRGSNVGLNVPGETDGAGNPLVDAQGQNTVQKAYSDLWFYSNPVFVESRYFAGDFHQHTTYSDGSNPFATVMAKNNEFGLDWWANSEHGGKFNRNAAGPILTSGFDTGGYAQFWDALGTTILGDSPGSSGGHANMWRWQSLRDFSFNDVLTARGLYPDKTIVQGVEWNVPGHEHCSVGMIADEFGPNANADAVSMFEYLWDANDADTSRGAKTTTNNHAKAVAAVQWMQANYPTTSWMVPAHPERRGVQAYPSTYTGSGSQGYSVAAFRDLNNAGPDVCFGFESMPGHQKDAGRGGYGTGASGGGTSGGCGTYAARVGGLWDAMLGEGRHFWLFASSDFHNTGGDFWPGEYQKTYTAATNNDAQSIVNGLRSGNSFVVEGDLIDALDFTVGSTDMGGTLASASNMVTISIRVHDPVGTNHGPAGLNTPALDHLDVIAGQYGSPIAPTDPAYTNDMNLTTRVIARFAATSGPADSTGLVSHAWTDLGDGWKQMTLSFDTQWQKTYFRLRGSNLGLNVVGQTDGAGNPLVDPQGNTANDAWADLWFYSNPVFVAPVISYTVWAAANASGQDADQDTNHTGVPNGIRYFMGATGSSPVANPGIVNGAVTWPKSPLFLGTYVIEVSSDLATWEPATTNYASYITDNGTSVVFNLPPVPGKIFTRMRVVPAP